MLIGYICQGGAGIGWGHVARGRAVMEAAAPGSAILVGRGFDEISAWARTNRVQFPIAQWVETVAPTDVDRCPYDVLIVDDYQLDPAWIESASGTRPTILVDDWMRHHVTATAVLNPNLDANRTDYAGSTAAYWLLGAQYALLRREVRRSYADRPVGDRTRLLLTLGGSDPDGRSADIADALTQSRWYWNGGELTIVLGASYEAATPWEDWRPSRRARVDVVRQPADFLERCAMSDLVICGGSTTSSELACLGRAFVPIAIVDNQARVARAWSAHGIGRGLCVWQSGWLERLIEDVEALAADADLRRRNVAVGRAVVDGRGVERLLDACRQMYHGSTAPANDSAPRPPARIELDRDRIRLRLAQNDDAELIWQWRNDPTTRAASLTTIPIPLDAHRQWFAGQLRSPDVALFLVEVMPDRVPCGQLRLNRLDGSSDALVSISIADEWRGKGLGAAALGTVIHGGQRPEWAQRFIALIRLDNIASQRLFHRLGFVGPQHTIPASLGSVPSEVGVWLLEKGRP